MSENRIEIMLEMIDKASPEFRRMNADTIRQVQQLEQQANQSFNKIERAGEKTTTALEKFNKTIRGLRTSLIGLGIVMGVALKGLNDAAQYSEEAKKTSDAFNKSLKGLSATLGQTFQPAIYGLKVAIDGFRFAIEAAIGGFVKLFAFTFEFLAQLPSAFKNIADNIKSVFTGDDPIGIIDGFRRSFDRAMEVANIATDQILQDFELTRSRIETGETVEVREKQIETIKKAGKKADDEQKKREDERKEREKEILITQLSNLETYLSKQAETNKAAAVAFKIVQMGRAVINTSEAITEALPNLPLAAFVAAVGAAEIATIAATGFAKGTDSVPSMLTPGEMVVPRDFASAIRSGDLSLSGPGGGSFGDINIFIQGGINPGGASIAEMAEQLGFAFEKEVRLAKGF